MVARRVGLFIEQQQCAAQGCKKPADARVSYNRSVTFGRSITIHAQLLNRSMLPFNAVHSCDECSFRLTIFDAAYLYPSINVHFIASVRVP